MFITLEGPEGAGKTTALAALAHGLRGEGREVVTTKEPGAGETGAAIRDLLLHGEALPPATELFLFLADRANHVARVIRPALDGGKVVLCDRFADSTFVYQAAVRGLDPAFVRQANAFATGGLKPDLTLLFDLDPEIGLARLKAKDRLDLEPLDFHQKVRAGFLRLAEEEPVRFSILDATQNPEDLAQAALAAVRERLMLS